MLVWKSQSGGVPVVPACLEGWEPRAGAQLVHRETGTGHVVGIGDPLVWTEPRKDAWQDVGDGWCVSLVPGTKFEPRLLARLQGWADVVEVLDMHRRTWVAPAIRKRGGGRAFRVAYGRNWLPSLSPEQTRAEEICAAALEAKDQDTPMAVACQWAAELLSMSHHVTPEALAALSLIDDTLAVEVLRLSASIEIEAANGL
jgi:hypothetical protein